MTLIYNILFRLTVLAHALLIIGNIICFVILPVTGIPWYFWLPMESFLFNLFFNRAFKDCPITAIESKLRIKIGKPPIKSFLGHYLFSPIRKLYRRLK